MDEARRIPPEQLNPGFMAALPDRFRHRGGAGPNGPRFADDFTVYLDSKKLSESQKKNNRVLCGAVERYETYRATIDGETFSFHPAAITREDVSGFAAFLRDESEIYETHPELYTGCTRKPARRGNNTISGLLQLLRTFCRWCHLNGVSDNNPFDNYRIEPEVYGTPYYITLAERDIIERYDLSDSPALEAQRDVFIFQCYIGCRVSDLYRLTPANIIRGAVEYIPNKTREERGDVVRVPIHPRAAAILDKYRDNESGKLLPFISQQKYNQAIKRIFRLCGITRPVTLINSITGEEEQRPLCDVASSHMARRTFVGNLYKQVKDPNLIGKLSGHKEGSRAFSRYRDIDEEMRRDLIGLLSSGEEAAGDEV